MQFFAGRWREDHDTHRLSRRMAAIIRQNLTFAIGVMAVLVTGGLFFELPLPLIAVHDGEARVQDDPFVEAREQFDGYFLIEAADDDEPRKWVARGPGAIWGRVEVRRIRDVGEH